jgi:sulfur carrier protein
VLEFSLGLPVVLAMLPIVVNGAEHVCRNPAPTVADLMRELSLDGKRIAVERNGEIVPKSRHREIRLAAGDRIEVVVAVGGG